MTGKQSCKFHHVTSSILDFRSEAAMALRQRLNETIDQLDQLQVAHAELQMKFESHDRELTVAKSNREFYHTM